MEHQKDTQFNRPIDELMSELKSGQIEPFSLGELESMCDTILASSGKREGVLKRPLMQRQAYRPFAAFAVLAFVALVTGIKYLPSTIKNKQQHDNTRSYATARGQRATVRLEDGSVILLAPDTRIQVSGRTVSLMGEAYFTVTHTQGEPFIVHTQLGDTRVLGTSFVIRHYRDDNNLKVLVSSGKVKTVNTIINAGEGTIINPRGKSLPLNNGEIVRGLAWTSDRLIFENEPIGEVFKQLERWYGVKFSGADSVLLNRTISGTFDEASLSPTKLNALSMALDRKFEMSGSLIRITK